MAEPRMTLASKIVMMMLICSKLVVYWVWQDALHLGIRTDRAVKGEGEEVGVVKALNSGAENIHDEDRYACALQ